VTDSASLDLVRSIFAPLERGDYRKADWAHPEIEYVLVDGPDPGVFTGLAGLAEAKRVFLSVTDQLRTEAEGYRELDPDCVLVLTRYSGRGEKSGVPFAARGAEVLEIHDGKVTRMALYWDRERAFADLLPRS
jgi:ketosteroid isomerase-like protein